MKSSLAFAAVMCAACTHESPPPNERLAQAVDLVRDASSLGAAGVSDARAALRHANDEIDRASWLMKAGKNAEAKQVLARAGVDAELALELARENVIRERARQAKAATVAAREGK